MQIGTFIRDETGAYTGTIKTLTLNVKGSIKPCDRNNDKAPDYRVTVNGVECGAGWSKRRIPLAQARRPVLHDPGLRVPGPGRQGRAQAHLVALNRPAAPCSERGAAPFFTGIMHSGARPNSPKNQPSPTDTPHNDALRIIDAMWSST